MVDSSTSGEQAEEPKCVWLEGRWVTLAEAMDILGLSSDKPSKGQERA